MVSSVSHRHPRCHQFLTPSATPSLQTEEKSLALYALVIIIIIFCHGSCVYLIIIITLPNTLPHVTPFSYLSVHPHTLPPSLSPSSMVPAFASLPSALSLTLPHGTPSSYIPAHPHTLPPHFILILSFTLTPLHTSPFSGAAHRTLPPTSHAVLRHCHTPRTDAQMHTQGAD